MTVMKVSATETVAMYLIFSAACEDSLPAAIHIMQAVPSNMFESTVKYLRLASPVSVSIPPFENTITSHAPIEARAITILSPILNLLLFIYLLSSAARFRGGSYLPSSSLRTSVNASCGTVTVPNWRILFLPAFCFSSSFFLRDTSPP